MNTDHPIRKARWIWPEGLAYLYNHFAHFRRDFQLKSTKGPAVLHLTADKSYKLFVNGQYVCRGPARGYQAHWPFDSIDLQPFLKKGQNWICVEAYNPGISTFQYLHLTRAGLLCAPEGRQLEAAWKASDWNYRRSPAHETQTARLSIQIDFQEHVDLAKGDQSWITSPRPPEKWEPTIFGSWEAHNYMSQSFGTPPYLDVEPRGIPMMREWVLPLSRVVRTAIGKSDLKYESPQNVSWFWAGELDKIKKFEEADTIASRLTTDGLTINLPATGKGRYRAVFIQAGEFSCANLIVKVKGAKGGEILDFQYDQTDADGNAKALRPGQGCLAAMSSRLRLAAGTNEHEFYQLIGFQHLTLIARDLTQPITISISLRCAGYPFTFTGDFSSSDEALTQIRAACQLTQQLCSFDAYVDTPWREQAQWWGDARVQARNTFYLDGDARLLARGIRSIAGQPGPQGLTYGHAPTSADSCILPDFALTWILTIWDYYYQTGDISLFIEQCPRVEQVLGYFRTPEAVGRLGLLQYDPRFWLFEDWADLPKETYPCFLNLWYLVALRRVVEMYKIAKLKSAATDYAKLAKAHEQRVVRHFHDAKSGLLWPALDAKGKPHGKPSVHDQTMGLMLNLVPSSDEAKIQKVLLPYLRDEKLDGAVASAFWCFYTLEEMAQRGYGAEVVNFIRRHWEPMLSNGTTWENFDSIQHPGSSNCHAWTAHPAVHLVNILGGIRQAAPDWAEIDFKPIFLAGIDHTSATVPSPRGKIQARWERKGNLVRGELKLPRGVKARIVLPTGKTLSVAGKSYRFAWNLPA